jgi:tRNA dimethylallyltransferase
MDKLIVVLGPTASGKSSLAVKLAKKFNGEIISADSRQVYKKMNIGTGKITKKEMEGIPHYLLDVTDPKKIFNASQYKKGAEKAIANIQKKGKLPFLAGGTGFYIKFVIDGIESPEVPADWKMRKELEKRTTEDLFKMLKKLDPRRAKQIDRNNPRRLIRAIEIIKKTGKRIPEIRQNPLPLDIIQIGIKKYPDELKKLIRKRLLKRLEEGMVKEVKKLHKEISWKRLEEFGLEYRYVAFYLQNKISYKEMVERLQKEIEHFAKRQMTWFKRDSRIHWVKNYKEALALAKKFVKK